MFDFNDVSVDFLGMSHGLALIAAYDDEEDTEEIEKPAKKIKLQNPLKNVKIGEEDQDQVLDDPSLHDFRVRSFPHVRGNWASYAYIKTDLDWSPLQKLLKHCLAKQDIVAKDIPEPHLSVSKVVTLQHHWIQPFVQSFQTKLKSRVVPFNLSLGSKIKVLVNEDFTRTFITLEVQNSKSLREIVKCCDESLIEYNKEIFYDPPEFHVSLLWTLGDQKSFISLEALQNSLSKWMLDEDIENTEVNSVECKIGNKFFTLRF